MNRQVIKDPMGYIYDHDLFGNKTVDRKSNKHKPVSLQKEQVQELFKDFLLDAQNMIKEIKNE